MTNPITLTSEERNRYARQLSLPEIGLGGQKQLKAAKVLVIGAGGLGCPVLQYLAAAGVGTIGIVDGDLVDASNLHRQVLYSADDIGKPKAQVALEKLRHQNPHVHLVAHATRLGPANALSLVAPYDLVVDGCDNFATRYLVNDACVLLNKPLVSGSVFRFEGQVSVFNYQGGPTYRCLYPEPGDSPSCVEAGVLGVLPGLIGCLLANETIKIITGAGKTLSGRLLVVNALTLDFNTYHLSADPEHKNIRSLAAEEFACANSLPDISGQELIHQLASDQQITVLDVREAWEYASFAVGGKSVPLGKVNQQLGELPKELPVVVVCQSGVRSRQAAQLLTANGYRQVASLLGGLAGLQPVEIDALRALLQVRD